MNVTKVGRIAFLRAARLSTRRTDDAIVIDQLTHHEHPPQDMPSRIKRRRLSDAAPEPEQDVTQADSRSIIVPGFPLEGDPFGPHWSIAEDAGSYNPPNAPNIDVSPKVTQQDWDRIMASIPPHDRIGLLKQDYHFNNKWLIGKPMFPHQLPDRARADLNMIDDEQGGFEPLPPPSLPHDEQLWSLHAQTHTFDHSTESFVPVDQEPKRAEKKSLLTEEQMERNVTGFLTKSPAERSKRTAHDEFFAPEA
ncbi:uncharacterized protein MYCFIDRAFT_177607 [Pseudocercospora fijiensis CIRAD86]|uniref:Uncharacterized protein n=1 Tax=Pseudocercospora fijiensis (strain CIRAD86) TaxID=383855 RepID=M3A7U1_PSEFD|nr:uncharacterized protein MYCFIDRAFT_177607 [Pseudocercospora fijiensis CIRAD86]EME80676.1 hypothetical protein MYCFIDRAFT_177607 [Pseudocercospora fijiensis CIRAD86]